MITIISIYIRTLYFFWLILFLSYFSSPGFFHLLDFLWRVYWPSHPDSARQHDLRGRSLEGRAMGHLARRWVAWMGGRGVEEREEVALLEQGESGLGEEW